MSGVKWGDVRLDWVSRRSSRYTEGHPVVVVGAGKEVNWRLWMQEGGGRGC